MHTRILPLMILLMSTSAYGGDKAETRCGWYDNPTPANVWLRDKDGEWVISVQGGFQAKGNDVSFNVDDEQTFEHTSGGSYGYGCLCMSVITDTAKKRILEIKSFKIKKLSVCRADKKLKAPK